MQGIKNRPCLRKDKGHTLCEPADAATPCHSTVAAACTQSEPGQLLTVTNTSNHDRPHFLLPRSLNIARLHGEPLALAAIYALALSALSLRSLASILAWNHRRLFDHTARRKAERTHEGLIVEPKLRLLS